MSINFDAVDGKLSNKANFAEGLADINGLDLAGNYADVVECTYLIPKIVELTGDKDKKIASAADEALKKIFDNIAPWAAGACFPKLKDGLGPKSKPPTKETILEIIASFSAKNPVAMSRMIEVLIQDVVLLMNDSKKSVKEKANLAMTALGNTCGNKDLIDQGFIPTIVKACESLKNVTDCVEALAGCIFVQNVEAPHLATITPVLWRGLNEKSEHTNRRCCVIVSSLFILLYLYENISIS